ncbi:hypothetical protein Hanom_Chr07g00659151 [Helianthus anomalus]
MADDLEAACNEPLLAYADLLDIVNEDGVDSLRMMLDPCYKQRLSEIFRCLDAAGGLIHLLIPVTEEMIKGKEVTSDDVLPRVSRSCKIVIYEDPSKADVGVVSLSADNLMETLPLDRVQRCRLVYERRRRSRSSTNAVDDQEVVALPVDEENVDDLIVDPHPLECYGVALYTPAEVRAMLSKKYIFRTCSFFCSRMLVFSNRDKYLVFCKIVVCIYYQNTYLFIVVNVSITKIPTISVVYF